MRPFQQLDFSWCFPSEMRWQKISKNDRFSMLVSTEHFFDAIFGLVFWLGVTNWRPTPWMKALRRIMLISSQVATACFLGYNFKNMEHISGFLNYVYKTLNFPAKFYNSLSISLFPSKLMRGFGKFLAELDHNLHPQTPRILKMISLPIFWGEVKFPLNKKT